MESADNEKKVDKNLGLTATEAKGEQLIKDVPGAQYNINDQAYSQSSKEDFVKTHSKFHHNQEGKVD